MQEEKKQELEKQKRKDKKKRLKLQHIAEKEGVSIQELEERHIKENEAKRLEEEQKKREEEERLRRETEAAVEEQRRREARERAIYNIDDDANQLTSAVTQRNTRNTAGGPTTRSKSVKFAQEVQVKEIPKTTTFVETQYTHIKIKKPDPIEKQPDTIQNVAAT